MGLGCRPDGLHFAVLAIDAGILRRRTLHADEHDEKQSDAIRLRKTDIAGVVGIYAWCWRWVNRALL
jgi:hypothetical protein